MRLQTMPLFNIYPSDILCAVRLPRLSGLARNVSISRIGGLLSKPTQIISSTELTHKRNNDNARKEVGY